MSTRKRIAWSETIKEALPVIYIICFVIHLFFGIGAGIGAGILIASEASKIMLINAAGVASIFWIICGYMGVMDLEDKSSIIECIGYYVIGGAWNTVLGLITGLTTYFIIVHWWM